MNRRKYSPVLLDALNERKRIRDEDGLQIVEKPIPETDQKGVIDPRNVAVLKETIPQQAKDQPFSDRLRDTFQITADYAQRFGKAVRGDLTALAEPVRTAFGAVRSVPQNLPVHVRQAIMHNEDYGGHPVGMRIYKPDQELRDIPVLIYFHGGGFVGGSLEGVDELCRFLAWHGKIMVVSVDYRLAPEHKFPSALSDCRCAVNWAWHNASRFGGDPEQIAVCGDSAGGNLAAACVVLDEERVRDGHRRRIQAQILLYPTLNLSGIPDFKYPFDHGKFSTRPEYRKLKNQMVYQMRMLVNVIPLALGKYSLRDPVINPYYADPLPQIPTLLFIGEYDCLRPETEAYAKKLDKTGTPVRLIRYAGIGHGYADLVGVLPQAEDTLMEITHFLSVCFSTEHCAEIKSRNNSQVKQNA
ncbi:MAG: alpha/beta hydrolase [Eubacteriaceae bacterium]